MPHRDCWQPAGTETVFFGNIAGMHQAYRALNDDRARQAKELGLPPPPQVYFTPPVYAERGAPVRQGSVPPDHSVHSAPATPRGYALPSFKMNITNAQGAKPREAEETPPPRREPPVAKRPHLTLVK